MNPSHLLIHVLLIELTILDPTREHLAAKQLCSMQLADIYQLFAIFISVRETLVVRGGGYLNECACIVVACLLLGERKIIFIKMLNVMISYLLGDNTKLKI